MSKQEPRVGDTVTLKGEVVSYSSTELFLVKFENNGKSVSVWFNKKAFLEVAPKPWEPKVGDRVVLKDRKGGMIYKIIALDEDDAWALGTDSRGGTCRAVIYGLKSRYEPCVD